MVIRTDQSLSWSHSVHSRSRDLPRGIGRPPREAVPGKYSYYYYSLLVCFVYFGCWYCCFYLLFSFFKIFLFNVIFLIYIKLFKQYFSLTFLLLSGLSFVFHIICVCIYIYIFLIVFGVYFMFYSLFCCCCGCCLLAPISVLFFILYFH